MPHILRQNLPFFAAPPNISHKSKPCWVHQAAAAPVLPGGLPLGHAMFRATHQFLQYCSIAADNLQKNTAAMVHTVAAACIKKDLKKQLGVCAIYAI